MVPTIPPTGHIVTLTLRVKPAFIDRMRVIAHELSVSSKSEDGCIAFITAESIETEGLFLIASVWRDKEAYEAHRYSPYVRAFESQIIQHVWREPVLSKTWRILR
jgi:quinol monooxygenase YgiN